LQGFFKTGKGEYGEGDIFLGIVVPKLRKISEEYKHLQLQDLQILLNSNVHEKRLISLFILVLKYQKASDEEREKIYDFYLKNTRNINNWDLVDLSAHQIVGEYLFDKDRKKLYELAKSSNLWEKRIAIISTFYFIREEQFEDSLKIGEILMNDKHDLIHKAVGWMLREIGKRDFKVEEEFVKKYCKIMPRTMLRYAIEKFPEELRLKYLKGEC
jgi:3-methyladenine DNA glycosylase AlkD